MVGAPTRVIAIRRTPVLAAALLLSVAAPHLPAQTIRGRLLDAETGQPIDLGLVMMFTGAKTLRMRAASAADRE